jgi:probable HAF family extracellular repeat protein
MKSIRRDRGSWQGRLVFALGAFLTTAAVTRAQDGLLRMYELIELRAEESDAQSRAYALNSTGQIVGWVEVSGSQHAAHWHNRVTTDLHGTVHFELLHPYPYYTEGDGEAYDISDAGQIVGTARTMTPSPPCASAVLVTNAFILRAAVLSDLATPYPGDALTNLRTYGDLCSVYDSAAIGISNSNYVVGWADLDGQIMRAFLVHPVNENWVIPDADGANTNLIDLGTLAASDPVSSATAVNSAGQVTGYSYTLNADGSASYHAFLLTPQDTNADGVPDLWSPNPGGVNTLMADLGTLGGANSWGRAINADGDVVGESDYDAPSGAHYTHAFYAHNGKLTDLGTLHDDPHAGFSAASASNDAGVIVGWAENEQRDRRAFIYEDGEMKDLNEELYLFNEDGSKISPSIVLSEARDINEDGVIVGWGTIKGSSGTRTRGFLLNPILVDPNDLLEPNQPGATTPGSGSTNPTYSSIPAFGPPVDPNAAVAGDQTETTTPTPSKPLLCGMQVTVAAPLTLLGIGWLRFGHRRRH